MKFLDALQETGIAQRDTFTNFQYGYYKDGDLGVFRDGKPTDIGSLLKCHIEADDWQPYPEPKCPANLGLATTGELIDEIKARIEIHSDGGLDYKTVQNDKCD